MCAMPWPCMFALSMCIQQTLWLSLYVYTIISMTAAVSYKSKMFITLEHRNKITWVLTKIGVGGRGNIDEYMKVNILFSFTIDIYVLKY
jgi:hypothetical protein